MLRSLWLCAFSAVLAACSSSPATTSGTTTAASTIAASTSASTSGGVQTTSGAGTSSGSGSSSSSGGTSSASTSGSSTGRADSGCNPSGTGLAELAICHLHSTLCDCPLQCVDDPINGTICEAPCARDSDCPQFGEHCQKSGFCSVVFCGPVLDSKLHDAGVFGVIDGKCDFDDAGDGTCVETVFPPAQLLGSSYTCFPSGGASTACVPALNAPRGTDAGLICPPGEDCYSTNGFYQFGLSEDAGVYGTCFEICDTTSTVASCAAGSVCTYQPGTAGVCLPSDGGTCFNSQATPSEFGDCGANEACACPLACTPDPSSPPQGFSPSSRDGGVCEYSCTLDQDCPDIGTRCVGGSCKVNYCQIDVHGDPAPSSFNAPCDVADAGDGLCVPSSFFFISDAGTFLPAGVCIADGTSTTSCDPNGGPGSLRSDLPNICAAGLGCYFTFGFDAGFCVPGCEPDGSILCPQGSACIQNSSASPLSSCFPVEDGGCLGGPYSIQELSPCGVGIYCACPQVCVDDPILGGSNCKTTCLGDPDCASGEVCMSGICQLNYCVQDAAGNPVPGAFNGPCNADGVSAASGTCNASFAAGVSIGVCILDGTATLGQACSGSFSAAGPPRTPATGLCTGGEVCSGSTCILSCDPTDGGQVFCADAGLVCLSVGQECGTCLTAASTCFVNGECCSGVCDGGCQ